MIDFICGDQQGKIFIVAEKNCSQCSWERMQRMIGVD
jgi:hypothetical protein